MRLVLKISLTIVLFVMIDFGLGRFFERLYWTNICGHANGEIVTYLTNSNVPDTLLIGSSRVQNMIDPGLIGKDIYSLSKPGNHFFYHAAVIDILASYNSLPQKAILLNLSVEDMFIDHHDFLMKDLHYLKYFYGKNDFVTSQINDEDPLNRLYYCPTLARFNGENFKLLTNYLQDICDPIKQFRPIEQSMSDSMSVVAGKEELRSQSYQYFNPKFYEVLSHLVEVCREHGVELILFKGINLVDVEGYDLAAEELRKLAKQNSFRFIDFKNFREKGDYPDSCWVDYIHLNGNSAIQYSQRIADIL